MHVDDVGPPVAAHIAHLDLERARRRHHRSRERAAQVDEQEDPLARERHDVLVSVAGDLCDLDLAYVRRREQLRRAEPAAGRLGEQIDPGFRRESDVRAPVAVQVSHREAGLIPAGEVRSLREARAQQPGRCLREDDQLPVTGRMTREPCADDHVATAVARDVRDDDRPGGGADRPSDGMGEGHRAAGSRRTCARDDERAHERNDRSRGERPAERGQCGPPIVGAGDRRRLTRAFSRVNGRSATSSRGSRTLA